MALGGSRCGVGSNHGGRDGDPPPDDPPRVALLQRPEGRGAPRSEVEARKRVRSGTPARRPWVRPLGPRGWPNTGGARSHADVLSFRVLARGPETSSTKSSAFARGRRHCWSGFPQSSAYWWSPQQTTFPAENDRARVPFAGDHRGARRREPVDRDRVSGRSIVVPSPSCPVLFAPQHDTAPPDIRAQA